jgi:Fe2+ transport system protein FeoA
MPASSSVPVRLSELGVGATARFHDARLDRDTTRYLRAIGLTRTSEFRICKNGEPCILQVRSTRIGLSRALAGQIFVVPLAREGA